MKRMFLGAVAAIVLTTAAGAQQSPLPYGSPVTLAQAGGAVWPQSGYILTTTGRTPVSGISKAKVALDAAMSSEGRQVDQWRLHDIRRTVATGLQRLGVRFEVTEAVLNHVSGSKGGVAGVYQRHDWADEKRSALEAWAGHVERLMMRITDTTVVRIRGVK